jgi:hypothetical protein
VIFLVLAPLIEAPPKEDELICVYCEGPAQGNYSIHRDGFDEGPEVPLCDKCGSGPTPTCGDIWAKISTIGPGDGNEWITSE